MLASEDAFAALPEAGILFIVWRSKQGLVLKSFQVYVGNVGIKLINISK